MIPYSRLDVPADSDNSEVVPFTAADRAALRDIAAFVETLQPLVSALPAMMESFGSSPVAKMLGLR